MFDTVTMAAPGSDEALRARLGGVTATEISALLGENPWLTPLDVWLTKLGLAPPVAVSEAMMIGNLLEPSVLALAERAHGKILRPGLDFASVAAWDQNPLVRASLDGLDLSGHPVEAKVTSRYWAVPPIHYLDQVRWQCGVVGADFGTLAVLRGTDYAEHHIRADPEWFDMAVSVAISFFERHVVAGERPPAGPGDNLANMWEPDVDSVCTVAEGDWAAYLGLRAAEAEAVAGRKAAELVLQEQVQSATEILVGTSRVGSWRPTKPRRLVDRKALAAAGLDNQFTKLGEPGRSWRVK
jgi:putative phage-type endonuclease